MVSRSSFTFVDHFVHMVSVGSRGTRLVRCRLGTFDQSRWHIDLEGLGHRKAHSQLGGDEVEHQEGR